MPVLELSGKPYAFMIAQPVTGLLPFQALTCPPAPPSPALLPAAEEHDAYIVNMNFHRRMFEGPSSLSLFGSTAQEEEEEEAREEQELGAAVEECGVRQLDYIQ